MKEKIHNKYFCFKQKCFIIFSILIFCSSVHAFAQYPIPSYNILVRDSAFFSEISQNCTYQINSPNSKKIMAIHCSCSTGTLCNAQILVSTVDKSDILGPYSIEGGETLYIPIDEREWEVLVETDIDIIIDVYIE
ncbi:MAG: hypothetical protein Q8867_00895 [Bacteroidota bacterium]|nr:hypothetical protein [Bacteroidota bacterium]